MEKYLFFLLQNHHLNRKFYSYSSSSSSSSSSNSSSSSSQYKVRRVKFKVPLQQIEEEAMSEIGKFIETRDSVVMHNFDEKGFVYVIFS
jgi:hypothetical protein